MQNFHTLRSNLEADIDLLRTAARCASGDEYTTRKVTAYVGDPVGWLQRIGTALHYYDVSLAEIVAFQRDANELGGRVAQELEALRTEPMPVPGSEEFEALITRVREIEQPRLEAQRVLEAVSGLLTSERGQLHDRVLAGMKHAAAWLLKWKTREVHAAMARQLEEINRLVGRDIIAPFHSLEQLAADASRYAGEKLETPRLTFPAIKLWEKALAAAGPQIEDAPTPKAAA